jgi:hypothetical protein
VQGDNLLITTFFMTTALFVFKVGIDLAPSDAGQDRWRRPLMLGLFGVAALFLVAGLYWLFLRDLSSRITVILQQVATSPASWMILLLVVSVLVWFRRRKILPILASVNLSLGRIPPLLLVAIIVMTGFAIVLMALSPTKPDTVTPQTMGPHNTLSILDALQQARELEVPGGWNVLVTGPPESSIAKETWRIILTKGIKAIQFLDLPNYNVDLDAPPIPDPQFSGIVLHGNKALNRGLPAFGGCFPIKTTQGQVHMRRLRNIIMSRISFGSNSATDRLAPVRECALDEVT